MPRLNFGLTGKAGVYQMYSPKVSWEKDILVIRVSFTAIVDAMELLDHEGRRHRLVDKEALKAFIAEQACRASSPGRATAGRDESLTEWLDALLERAAKASAGIRAVIDGAATGPASEPASERMQRCGRSGGGQGA